MSKKLYEETNIQAIAAAIREKNESQSTYTAAQMADAIRQIHGDPILETLNANSNGDYYPSSGKDGFNVVHVNVQGHAEPILQEKTVTSNGIVLPDSGYDGLSKVIVNVESGDAGTSELDWDFTESLVDSKHGTSATLVNAVRDVDGIHINSSNGYCYIPSRVKKMMTAAASISIEVDIGDMLFDGISANHHRFIMSSQEKGLIYRNTNRWSFYNGSWDTGTDISNYDFFANSTVKIEIDERAFWHIYKDGVLVYEPSGPLAFSDSDNYLIGADSYSCANAVILGLRIKCTLF